MEESSESLLEAYGIVTTKNSNAIDTLNPKICPNCNEGNTQDARFCSKCKMIMSFEGYQEVLESEKKEKDELMTIKEQFSNMQTQMQSLISAFSSMKDQTQVDGMAKTLFSSGLIKEATTTTPTATPSEAARATATAVATEVPITTSMTDSEQNKQREYLIKEAGKAAYHAATTKSTITARDRRIKNNLPKIS